MEKIFEFIKKYKMFNEHDKVVAGISGGADSVCLLFVLLELKKKMDIDIVAVHVNHQIRGEAALHDQLFTEKICREHGVKCIVVSEDVPKIAKRRKQSLEEAGRDIRREAFEKVLKEENADKIAMAHHENDNAETFIMHLIRGAGLNGLSGIWPVNDNVVRPLLCVTRKEIENYVSNIGETWCDDLTNDEDDYTRNRIRHQVIPVLESETDGNAVKHINSAMEKIRLALTYIEEETYNAYNKCVTVKSEDIEINKEKLYSYNKIIRTSVIKEALYKVSGHKKDLGTVHFVEIEKLFERQSGKRCNLPYGVTAIRNYDGIVLKKNNINKKDIEIIEEIPLVIPGKTYIKEKNINIITRLMSVPEGLDVSDIEQKTYTKWFDYDIIKCKLVIRSKRAGDTITVSKDGHSKKIKSYFIDEKIPADQRSMIPLIADGNNILWVIGHRMSSGYQITKRTGTILEIKVLEEK